MLTPPIPTQAPAALTKPRSKRPLSLVADAAAKFTLPKEAEIAIGAAGIFLSYSVLAVQQENVYKRAYGGEYFKYTFLVLVMERLINAAVALVGLLSFGPSGLKIPHLDIFNSGVSQMLAMASSNEALRYVSYPTQVLGKSCKMVPVMAGGIVLGGKRFSLVEYVQVALITLGVVVFNFGGERKKGGAKDSPYGLALIGVSLLLDAVTGGLQDKVKVATKALNPDAAGPKRPSLHESMMWTNASGGIVALVLALLTGHMVGGIKFAIAHPEVLYSICLFSMASAVGQNFIFYVVTQFNPLVLTTVTTTRKIFSTLYSVFRNPANSLNTMQWSGCSLVFAGLLGDIVRKYLPAAPKAAPPPPPPAVEAAAEEEGSAPPAAPPAGLATTPSA